MTLKDEYIKILIQSNQATTILTPNRRLAAILHKIYQQHQLEQHQHCWHTPDILPLSTWLQRLWQDHLHATPSANHLLLNTIQEEFLWDKILFNAKESESLLQVSETADITKSAWSMLKQWQVNLSLSDFTQADEYISLKNWMNEFHQLTQQESWVDNASLPDSLSQKILEKEIITDRHLILIGFNEISPQLKHLLGCCKEAGNTIFIMQPGKQSVSCKRISFLDEEQEILSIARFSKSIFMKNNLTTVGCVFPALDKNRDRILQLFSQVFAEKNTLISNLQTSPFNISAGKSLLKYPIIHIAMQLLSLYQKIIPIDIMSYLLTSPFLGEAESERLKRANYDYLLKRENIHHINLTNISSLNENKRTSLDNHCPRLAKRINLFLSSLTDMNTATLTHHAWSIKFNELLTQWGFPGERSLNSHEYQIIGQFLNVLSEFATLDQVSLPVSYPYALKALRKIVAKHIFQPKSPDSPIQILGMLEAAGLPFDYLWISGMNDLSWPSKPNPNPLIPKNLQRKLQMPHASSDREFLYCESLTTQFKNSANEVIFSHAEKNEEGELQVSPLIRDIALVKLETMALSHYQSIQENIYHTKQMEIILDEAAPALKLDEIIHGGVNIIKQQALCPFKAFAESRLRAQTIETPLPGLRAKDRGTLLHKALELLWNTLKDHQTLITLTTEQLHHDIESSIESAFQLVPHSRNHLKEYLSLEKQRLHTLIWHWLQIEKMRTPFKVLMHEKIENIQFHQLTLSIRIDRIDELNDGKKLIIDYKMGKNQDIVDWFSERPIEPQLPLYALIDPDNTAGISFAQIHADDVCFKGMSQYSLDIKGIKLVSEIKKATALNWTEQLTQWKTTLLNLSNDFCRGVATVDPKASDTCHWCQLKPLCRIGEEIT